MRRWTILLYLFATGWSGPSFGDTCPWVVGTMARQYKNFLAQAGTAPNREMSRLFSLDRSQCEKPALAQRIIQFGQSVIQRHSGKIGVVLPLTGAQSALGLALQKGMRAWPGFSSTRVVFVDSKSEYRETLKAMADLRLKQNVALWVVGGPTATGEMVRDWADALRMPTLILGNQKIPTGRSRYALRIFPHLGDMARGLAQAAAEKGWKRIGVLLRTGGRGSDFISLFAKHAKPLGVEIHQVANYQSGDFPSMNESVKHLFQVDRNLRSEEFEKLKSAAQAKAEAGNLPFDPRRVILPGRRELDAVLIPDNFRMVRHFAKLFRYHKIFRMPLLGTPQWRNQGLVDPPDGDLRGSLFVDFVGPYPQLPAGIVEGPVGNFVPPDQATFIDAQLMGYRAMALASLPLARSRRDLIPNLRSAPPPLDPFFGTAPPFAEDGASHWPAFVYEVGTKNWKMAQVFGRYQGKRFLSSPTEPLDPQTSPERLPSTPPPSTPPPSLQSPSP